MHLDGFGFSGYRSFGPELIKIAPLQKINLIIGQNNSGKSNIIRFLYEHYGECVKSAKSHGAMANGFSPIDRHDSTDPVKFRVAFPLPTGEKLSEYVNLVVCKGKSEGTKKLVQKLLSSEELCDETGRIWFTYCASSPKGPFEREIDIEQLKSILQPVEWQNLWSGLTGQRGGSLERDWIPVSIRTIALPPSEIPNVAFIPAFRRVGDGEGASDDYSGVGIIERLARIQNPPALEQSDKEEFEAINSFAREVLEHPEATIEIPFARDMIIIHMDGKSLPLSSLGTGIHQVIILAAAATLLKKSILCVEEPELHLHPVLQRKLLKFLYANTDNQYIFTTHSAHLLDSVPAEIFHVTNSGKSSLVTAIASTKERSIVCADLGYRASDILQANCIIWVEGPSDTIYLNYWLRAASSDLIEGVHYSIMFYGGRLSSHVSGLDDDEMDGQLSNFISLRKLNRNAVILIDSDKENSHGRINATKKRLLREFDLGPGFAWITKGREVENYISSDTVESSVLAVHPQSKSLQSKDQWSNLLKYISKRGRKERVANKVKIARYITENYDANLEFLDLSKQIKRLSDFIAEINGLEV